MAGPVKAPSHCYLCEGDFETLDRLMTHLKRSCPGMSKRPIYRGRDDDDPVLPSVDPEEKE